MADNLAILALLSELQRQVNQVSKLQGPKGDDGAVGPQGPQGPKGEQGDVGPRGADGATGPRGADGAAGADGEDGVGVVSVSIAADGDLVFTLSDGTEHALELPLGLLGTSQGDTFIHQAGNREKPTTNFAQFKFDKDTDEPDVSDDRVGFDTDRADTTTILRFPLKTINGVRVSNLFDYYITAGTRVYIQQSNKPELWAVWQITGAATDNNKHKDYPVTFLAQSDDMNVKGKFEDGKEIFSDFIN